MIWHEKLYTSDINKRKLKSIKKRVENNRYTGAYLITIAANKDLLDIQKASAVRKIVWREPVIVGVASDYSGALVLACEMVRDSVNENGYPDVKGYFSVV